MSIKITSFKKIDKGGLYGVCNARIDAWHMEIIEITIFMRSGVMSFAMPSRPYEKADGKKGYASFIKLDDAAYGKIQIALRGAMEIWIKENPQEEEKKELPKLEIPTDDESFPF